MSTLSTNLGHQFFKPESNQSTTIRTATAHKLRNKSDQLVCNKDTTSPVFRDITSVYSHSDGSMTGVTRNKFDTKVKVTYDNKIGAWIYG